MLSKLPIPALLLSLAAALPLFSASETAPRPVPAIESPSAWLVPAASASNLTLATRDGALEIGYDVTLDDARVIREQTVYERSLFLDLKASAPVVERNGRVVFEARGQDGSAEDRRGTVIIRPVLEDENGERFSYEPYLVDPLKRGEPMDWSAWTTRPFLASEAGGANPNVYHAWGGDENRWPDGKLRLVGLEIRLRNNSSGNQPGRKRGKVHLASITLHPMRVAEEAPRAYLDAFLKTKGAYRLAWELSPAFQAAPVAAGAADIDFDPADEQSRRQTIAIPEASRWSNSWTRIRITDTSGKIVAEETLRWETNRPPEQNPAAAPLDLRKPPAVGLVRVNPGQTIPGVYSHEEPLEVLFRVFSAKTPATELKWELKSYAYPESLATGSVPLPRSTKAFRDLRVKLPEPAGQNAFRLAYSLVATDGAVLDAGEYILGKTLAADARLDRPGALPDRRKIKERPYNRITFHDGHATVSAADILKRFESTLVESRQITQHVTFMIDLSNFEILPGVYDFRILDGVMNLAADHGFGVTVRLAHAETKAPYLWLPHTKTRDFDGSVIRGHYIYKAFSMADGSYMDVWVKAFRAMHARYQGHLGFEGYYLMMPNGEWILPEEIWHGKIADYSWGAERAFRKYLQEDLGLSLAQLNARWGSAHATWDDVSQPLPSWELGTAPDLRPQWKDFSRFKEKLQGLWCIELGSRVRAFDDQRIIISYGAPTDLITKDGAKPIDYGHNGGNHNLKNEGKFVEAWDKGRGIGWITEPHHPHRWAAYGDPANRGRVLDWSLFVMFAQAGGGGANLHVYYHPNPTYDLAAHYAGDYAYDRFEHYKPVLRELHGMELISLPKQVAVFHDSSTIRTKHRTTFYGRTADMTRWFELLTQDSVPWETFDAASVASYKAIVANPLDEVLSAHSIKTLDAAVRAGATLVTSAATGRYDADDPDARFPLLKRLGIPAPTGAFETRGENIEAVFEPAFRDAFARPGIRFYSQADQRREATDSNIGKTFTRWAYRWIPESDYFGYYANNRLDQGEILARFPDGGAALSRHRVGKGTVVVFWGTPDVTAQNNGGLLDSLTRQAGVTNPQAGNPVPYLIEGFHPQFKRRYALLYQEKPGTYVQKLPSVPDGEWFVDDMADGARLGLVDGKTAREQGVPLTFTSAGTPLKVLRFIPKKDHATSRWVEKYGRLAP